MEVTSVQIYINQIMTVLADPMGMMAVIGMLALCIVVIITNTARWYVLAFTLFAISSSAPQSPWIAHVAYLAPLEILRTWSRPVTFGLLLVLATGMFRFNRGTRQMLLPSSCYMFFFYECWTSIRLFATNTLVDRGMGGLAMSIMLVVVCTMVIAPAMQNLRDASRALWAVAGCGMLFIGGTFVQYARSPNSVAFGGRLFGTSAGPQIAALVLAFTLPSLCYLFIRRKQGLALTTNVAIFATAIPAAVLMLIWTGSRTGVLTALMGLVIFFHRRLGRLAIAAAVCFAVGLVILPYFGDALQIADRLISTENTRAHVWTQMWEAVRTNPLFGDVPENAGFFSGYTVGEGSYLMSLSLYGIVGTIPLLLTFVILGVELLQLYRARALLPDMADLVDLLIGFWLSMIVAGFFEAIFLAYFTFPVLICFVMFTVQGFAMDRYRQALAQAQWGEPSQAQTAEYAEYYATAQ